MLPAAARSRPKARARAMTDAWDLFGASLKDPRLRHRFPRALRAAGHGGPIPGGRIAETSAARIEDGLAHAHAQAVLLGDEATPYRRNRSRRRLDLPLQSARYDPISEAAITIGRRMQHARRRRDAAQYDGALPVGKARDRAGETFREALLDGGQSERP